MKKTPFFFLLFISFFCLMTIPFVNTTKGAMAYLSLVDWDSAIGNSCSGSTDYIDYSILTHPYGYTANYSGKVSTAYAYSGSQSFRQHYSNYVDENKEYGSSSQIVFDDEYGYIRNLTFYLYFDTFSCSASAGTPYQYIYLYNGSNWVLRFEFKVNYVSSFNKQIYVYDGTSQKTLWSSSTDIVGDWLRFRVSNVGGTSNFYVTLYDKTNTTLLKNVTCGSNGVTYQTFTKVIIDWDNNGTSGTTYMDAYLDDININYGTPPSSGESCELSDYNTFGNLGDSHTTSLTGRYLEISYNTRINTSLHAFELYCDKTQYDHMPDLSDYYLYINCVGMGWPTEWISYGNGYLLRWCGDVGSGWPLTINNERLIFEVACNVAYNTRYWYLFQNYGNGLSFRKHNLLSYFGNCLPNGDVVNFYEPCYRFYYGTIVLQGECYDNNIIDAMYKETYYTYTPINLVTQVSSLIYTNYIGVKNGTTWKTNLSLTKCTEVSYYVPEYWGYYNFSLRRNSVFYDDVVLRVVNNSDIKHILYVIPESGSCSGTIHIYYRFYHGNGNDGMIYIKDENGFTFESSLIHDNTSGWVNWTLPNCCVPNICTHYYDISMYVNTGGLNWSFIKNIQYYLSFEGGHDDIRVLYNPLCLGDDSKGSQTFDINVSLPSMNPRLFLNNNEIFDHLHTGRYNYTITDNKFYVVSIGYKTYKGITYLANASFTATFCNGSIPPSGLIPEIGQPYGMFAGFLLTITCFLFPLFLTKGVLQFNTFIATVISLGSGGMGLCASVILNFIPIWVLAFILFLCILIILIIWLARKIGST